MEFHRPKKKPITVPIVPLIDILVTLLFFFIVTMNDLTPKVPQSEVQVNLPSAGTMKVKTVKTTRSTLKLGREGQAELDSLLVPEGLLKEYLVANLSQRPGLKLAIKVDKACDFERVLIAHSAALEAGYPPGDIVYPVEDPNLNSSEQ